MPNVYIFIKITALPKNNNKWRSRQTNQNKL